MTTISHGDLQWINVVNPDAAMLKKFERKYKFHPLDLEDCLTEIELQRPKIDDYDNYIFIILHFPKYNKRTHRVEQAEVNLFIGQNYVISIHRNYKPVNNLFEDCKKKKFKEQYMNKGSGYLLYIVIDSLFDAIFPMVDRMSASVNDIEKEVFDLENARDRLQDILSTKKDIINFRRILMPQRTSIAQLEHKNKKFLPEDLDIYFDDIVDKIERLYSSVDNLSELTDSLQNTNESIISHNTNNIIRVLTIFSVIMLPLTLLTGFYGMNVTSSSLPAASHPQSAAILAGTMILIAAVMIIFFKFKKWL